MKAYLLSIGCDKYQSELLPELFAAENDASAIYEVLVNSEYAFYDESGSVCLKSPNKAEIIQALENVLYEIDCPDILTIFFAGHGGVFSSTYYLCVSETRIDRVSFTALSLSEIFRIVSASEVKHVNLIIDACNTAGLVNDLVALVKPDLIGAKGSFGVSILAAAASDETAMEIGDHGLLTESILNIIKGKERINTHSDYLDLVNIGRSISTKFIESGIAQTPSSWGMNLYGPSIFAKNPFHSSDDSIPILYFSYIPPASRVGRILSEHKSELLEAYENIERLEGIEEFLKVLNNLVKGVEKIDDLIAIIRGVGYRFIEKSQPVATFKQLEIINGLLTLLIPHIHESTVNPIVAELSQLFKFIGNRLILDVNTHLKEDKYFLISKEVGGFGFLANYFYLPVRISKMLGYFGQLLMIDEEVKEHLVWFVNFIKAHYQNHVSTISEVQAPFIHTFFRSCLISNESTIAKSLLYDYINNYLTHSGKIASINLNPEDAPLFLIQRTSGDKVSTDLKANHAAIGTVLLLQASYYGMGEELDLHMHELDRKSMHIFIPHEIKDFGNVTIENGINLVPKCGFDFWTCEQFVELFEASYRNYSNINLAEIDITVKFSCVAASFCLPDRVPTMY